MPSPETWKKAEELLPAEHVALLKKIDADLENLARENHNLKMEKFAMVEPSTTGMSLRDWFAGQALNGLLAGLADSLDFKGDWTGAAARDAFRLADSMLAEREKKETKPPEVVENGKA